jgi:hypothetical protein
VPPSPTFRQPPPYVALVARTHWLVGATIVAATLVLRWATIKFPIEFSTRTYAITGGLAAIYLLGGTLVWFGAPFGRLLSRVCGLIYLARPRLGSYLWQIMDSPEYQAHFERGKSSTDHPPPSDAAEP